MMLITTLAMTKRAMNLMSILTAEGLWVFTGGSLGLSEAPSRFSTGLLWLSPLNPGTPRGCSKPLT